MAPPMSDAALLRRLLDMAHASHWKLGRDCREVPPFDRYDPELHRRCVLVRDLAMTTSEVHLADALHPFGDVLSEAIDRGELVGIVVLESASAAQKALEEPAKEVGKRTAVCEAVPRALFEEAEELFWADALARRPRLTLAQVKAALHAAIQKVTLELGQKDSRNAVGKKATAEQSKEVLPTDTSQGEDDDVAGLPEEPEGPVQQQAVDKKQQDGTPSATPDQNGWLREMVLKLEKTVEMLETMSQIPPGAHFGLTEPAVPLSK